MNEVERFLQTCIDNADFPSAVYLVAEGCRVLANGALGQSVVPCEEAPSGYTATLDTIYDLASLTKPLFTGYLLLRAFQDGLLKPETTVEQILPEFSTHRHSITIQQLATHSAGFKAWLPLYALTASPQQVLQTIAMSEPAYTPASSVIYSDLGYITLGVLLERVYKQPLTALLADMTRTFALETATFNPPQKLRQQIAASETGNIYERGMAKEAGFVYEGWRKQLIWGSVHDYNCYFLGGVSGHAGLFAAVRDVHRLAVEFTPDSSTLQWKLLKKMVYTDLTYNCSEGRSIGWLMGRGQLVAEPLGQDSLGHTGFTGTSIWIEPKRNRIYILLTNRTHPVRKEFNINERRRAFHKLASAIAS